MMKQFPGKIVSFRKRVEPQKLKDSSHVTDGRMGVPILPIDQRHLVAPDDPGSIDLAQFEVQPPLPNVFPNTDRESRVALDSLKVGA